MEYIMYCDESSAIGDKYGDFFGGCLINSKYLVEVVQALEDEKKRQCLYGEIKWTKVTEQYLEKYKSIMDLFFKFIKENKIKVRIMFRNMQNVPSAEVIRNNEYKYFKLYYQFIKHAFGLTHIPDQESPMFLRIYLDQLPDKREKCEEFKKFLRRMPNTEDFSKSKLFIRPGDIAEVCSHDHVLLQCTDIVLGAMFFRLNNLHKAIPEGKKRRGKRTVAKESLYNHINSLIQEMFPHFNIGVSSGDWGYANPRWQCPYRHWNFRPKK